MLYFPLKGGWIFEIGKLSMMDLADKMTEKSKVKAGIILASYVN